MALLFMDGFEQGASGTAYPWTKYGYQALGGTSGIATFPVRTGLRSLCLDGTLFTKPLPAVGGFVFGAAYQLYTGQGGLWTTVVELMQAREGVDPTGIVHLALATTAAGTLSVKRGTTVLATGTLVLQRNIWYYVEFKGVIDNVAGSFEVRINGVPEIVGSGVPTRNGGTGQWNVLGLNGARQFHDDLYVCDLSGPRNNGILGMPKIETLIPRTDAVAIGSNRGLTPSTGTDHGALVRDVPGDTTSYNGSASLGAKDTYRLAPMVLNGPAFGIQTNLLHGKTDIAPSTACHVARSGGVDYDGPTVSPKMAWSVTSHVREVDPATGAPWADAAINALEVGMKVTG